MHTINESELVLVVLSKALKRLHIIQTAQGRFRIKVILKNQEEERDLVTYRKQPREWVSLDRLAKHIREKCGAIPPMTLTLLTTGENQQ
jgi:hypothetical protein